MRLIKVLACLFTALAVVAIGHTGIANAELNSTVTGRFFAGEPDPDGNPADSAISYCGGTGQPSCPSGAGFQVGWGTAGRSTLSFTPATATVSPSASGNRFAIGSLAHNNQVIGLTEGMVGVKIHLAVTVTDTVRGISVPVSGSTRLEVEESSNLVDPCPFNDGFGPNCPDRIRLTAPHLDTTVNAGNVAYRINDVRFNTPEQMYMVTAEGTTTARGMTALVRRVSRVRADAGPDQTVDEASAVNLDGTASEVDDLTYNWSQISGPVVTLVGANTATPSFTAPELTESASVTFRLTVADALEPDVLNDTDTVTINITDINDPPVARTNGPYVVDEGSTVELDGSDSSDPDGQALVYRWDFDTDGSVDSTVPQPSFDAALRDGPESVPVRLTVCDTFDVCDSVDTEIKVRNVAPAAIVAEPNVVDEGSTITLSATGTDPAPADQVILSFEWDLDGDGAFDDASGPTPSLTPPDGPREITVGVEVCDDDGGCDIAQGVVDVRNVAPTVDAGPDLTIYRNDVADLSGSFTDPAEAFDEPYRFDWSGDAPFTSSSGTLLYGSTAEVSTVYPIEGSYSVRLEITDDDAASGTDELVITVLNRPPVCSEAGPSIGELWPPNHKYIPITIEGLTDPEGDELATTITYIRQDEPVDAGGSGNTSTVDGRGVGTSEAEVKSERAGPQDSRFYHIAFEVDDGHGGSCTGTVRVIVPHDQGINLEPFDGGPLFDSTIAPN